VLGPHTVTVVGVVGPAFPGLFRGVPSDVWLPISLRPLFRPGNPLENRGARDLLLVGRLAPGASADLARAQLETVATRMQAAHPEQWTDALGQRRRVSVLPEAEARVVPQVRGAALGVSALLSLVVGLVLLLACANVASLMLVRGADRRRELAVRLSLGADRGRLLRQLLTESLLLSLLGGAAGLLLAAWATDAIAGFRPPLPVPVEIPVRFDLRAALFAVVLSLGTGLAVGLAPALRASRAALADALREGGSGSSGGTGRSRLHRGFVVAQVTASLVLLAAGGLFLRSLANAASIDPGFRLRDGILLSYDVSLAGRSPEEARQFHERVLERVASLPGVRSATLGIGLPLGLEMMRRAVWVEGDRSLEGDREEAFGIVGPGYFETLGVDLVRGRGFTGADRPGAPLVAVVNESFARRFWPGADALGKRISVSGPEGPFLEVVGVARDGKYFTLGESPRPFYYLPLLQEGESLASLVVRTEGDPAGLLTTVRAAVQELDTSLPLWGMRTVRDHLAVSLMPTRVAGLVVGAFGLLGLALAAVGLHGLLAYAVRQRTREIGVRLAMGAAPGAVLAQVLREGLALVLVGLAIGAALAVGLGSLLRTLLYGLHPADPLTFAAVAALMAAVALLALWAPARRASRVDPVQALRCE
jgi:predicted permease